MRQKKLIEAGQRFGKLVTIKVDVIGKYGKEWLCLCDCGKSTRVIGANLNRGHTLSCGCYGRTVGKHYLVNEKFFYEINNERKAYWLGFLYADGNIGRDLKTVKLTLQKLDALHIQKFLQDVSSTHPIKTYKEGYPGVSIKNKEFCGGLVLSGLFPNKSREIRPPTLLGSLQRHFWRGVMDGDGTISIRKSPGFSIFGNKYTCLGFGEFLVQNGVHTLANVTTNKFGVSAFSTSGRIVTSTALELLYGKSTVYLDRKYLKYKNILGAG